MIFLNDHIRYERVLSKSCEFYYEELGTHLTAFLEEVKESGAHFNGPVFYTLNNIPKDKIMNVEFFIPVKEDISTSGSLKFHSFYSVEKILSICITENFEYESEAAYSALLHFMEAGKLKQLSPIYHVIDTIGEQPFVTVKIAYIESGE